MLWLILGLALWWGGHLFKRVAPGPRARLGKAGRGLVAVTILAGVVLMVVGYRAAETSYLYSLPAWSWTLNNLLMYPAILLMDIGRVKGVLRTKIRHPMLTGVLVWSAAHLLVNGDLAAVILFGGLGLWALVEMAVINRAEGDWVRPERGSWSRDLIVAAIAAGLYAVIAGLHVWLGYPVFGLV